MTEFSVLDVAPTIARVLEIDLPEPDGKPIVQVEAWRCSNVILLIVDSLGYEMFQWLEPKLKHISALARRGLLLKARAVSNKTTPAIASILSGLYPEHHGILDKEGAKESSILSIPEIASASGLRSAVIMEKNGAEVYEGLIEIIRGIPDSLNPESFDREACRMSQEALAYKPRLLVSYFIGIDKTVHMGLGPKEIRDAAILIDQCVGLLISLAQPNTLIILCGDHPVHAGKMKRMQEPYCVTLILAKVGRSSEIDS